MAVFATGTQSWENGGPRVLLIQVAEVGEDMWMSVDLSGLGPQGFEEMCRALGVRILGPGITAFGAGPDGGREASFSGLQQFPNTAEPWNGYGIMQAKYKAQLRGD